VTRLGRGGSSGVLPGALRRVQASISSARGKKASGTWLLRECYSPPPNALAGTEVRALQGRWHNGHQRPVLKHGPRSRGFARVFGCKTRTRNESERR
jgi:hypothetical protein